jgi:hypothetical protein
VSKYLMIAFMALGTFVGAVSLAAGDWKNVAGGFIALPLGLLWFIRRREQAA